MLGVSPAGVRAAVARHRLPAAGNGKARRLPRATVEALAARSGRGIGPATYNHVVKSCRGFGRWLRRTRRAAADPFDTLAFVPAAADVRRARRELTGAELAAVFAAARASDRPAYRLSGEDRYHLYRLAAGTGIRAGALGGLTPGDFDLTADIPTVTVPARLSKNGQTSVRAIPADVAAELSGYLSGRPADAPVWPGTWARDHRGASVLRRDLAAAGVPYSVPYSVPGPDGPRYADFHALRHSYLTLLGRSGVDLIHAPFDGVASSNRG